VGRAGSRVDWRRPTRGWPLHRVRITVIAEGRGLTAKNPFQIGADGAGPISMTSRAGKKELLAVLRLGGARDPARAGEAK
jgi:hypothetical protein